MKMFQYYSWNLIMKNDRFKRIGKLLFFNDKVENLDSSEEHLDWAFV